MTDQLIPPSAAGLDDLVDVVARLGVELADISVHEIITTVVGCRRDLSGVPATALPEMVERLARQRLLDAHGGAASGAEPPGR